MFCRNGEEWLQFRRILNKVMLLSDPTDMFVGPCQKAAEGLVEKWMSQLSNDDILSQLETQLYQWSIEGEYIYNYIIMIILLLLITVTL